jgi:uncharacterized protein YbbC (DUF1343 family)
MTSNIIEKAKKYKKDFEEELICKTGSIICEKILVENNFLVENNYEHKRIVMNWSVEAKKERENFLGKITLFE